MTPALTLPTPSARRWLWASVAAMAASAALGVFLGNSLHNSVLWVLPPAEALWLGVVVGQGVNARLKARGLGRLPRRLLRLGTALVAALATWALVLLHASLLGASRDLGYAADQLGMAPLWLLLGAALATLGVWVWHGLRQDGVSPVVAALQTGVVLLLYGLFAAVVANPLVVIILGCMAPGQGGCNDF